MQNKLYNTTFSLPHHRFAASPWAVTTEPGTCGFRKTPKKDQTPGKIWSLRQERIQSHGKEKEKNNIPPPSANPHSQTEHDVYGMEYFHCCWKYYSTGWAAWLCSLPAPAHLLSSWIWATGRSPWFLSSNWKHQCYLHSAHTKSKTQQLLGGKLTLSQLKPGQGLW